MFQPVLRMRDEDWDLLSSTEFDALDASSRLLGPDEPWFPSGRTWQSPPAPPAAPAPQWLRAVMEDDPIEQHPVDEGPTD